MSIDDEDVKMLQMHSDEDLKVVNINGKDCIVITKYKAATKNVYSCMQCEVCQKYVQNYAGHRQTLQHKRRLAKVPTDELTKLPEIRERLLGDIGVVKEKMSKKHCELCDCHVARSGWNRHTNSNKHQLNMKMELGEETEEWSE